jgi:hypothetical protein
VASRYPTRRDQARERDRDRLQADPACAMRRSDAARGRKALPPRLCKMLADWRGLLDEQFVEARNVLGALLTERLCSRRRRTRTECRAIRCAARSRLAERPQARVAFLIGHGEHGAAEEVHTR